MHSSVFLCCLSPTTAVCVETHTIVSTAFNLVAQLVVHMARTSNAASAHWLSASMCCLCTSSLICISTPFGLPVSHPLLSVHADLKHGLAVCVQSEHAPTDTAPVSVHFCFLFGTPLHHLVQASVSRRGVHHALAARPGL